MPTWAGKWQGGRYYLDELGEPVYFIERRRRSIRLKVKDKNPQRPLSAIAELSRFLEDPDGYCRALLPEAKTEPVYLTDARITLYLASIRGTVLDHRKARRTYLTEWSALKLDMRDTDRKRWRAAVETFDGGRRGRVEALNAFARWLVKEGELPAWRPLPLPATEATRAAREAYSLEQLRACYARLPATQVRDVFLLRAATGMHQTEIDQLEGARWFRGPLPDKGTGIRSLGRGHEIRGVLQVLHKNGHRHRVSVNGRALLAALRIRARGAPRRGSVWKALAPLVPSNLRHTFVTLAGEVGEWVTYTSAGIDRGRIAQAVGHRAGSTMTADRYDKVQVPPMIKLPLGFG